MSNDDGNDAVAINCWVASCTVRSSTRVVAVRSAADSAAVRPSLSNNPTQVLLGFCSYCINVINVDGKRGAGSIRRTHSGVRSATVRPSLSCGCIITISCWVGVVCTRGVHCAANGQQRRRVVPFCGGSTNSSYGLLGLSKCRV